MSLKIFLLCVQVFLVQSISGQYIGAATLIPVPCASVPVVDISCTGIEIIGPEALIASNGPGLAVSSVSPLIPLGVSVISENGYEGALAVGGVLPLLGTTALEGSLPTDGAGGVSYDCGGSTVTITAEDINLAGSIVGSLGTAGVIGIPGSLGIVSPLGVVGQQGVPGAICGCGII